jgi:hypothetical protein
VQFVADGVFFAELNELLTRELAEDGYSGVEVRVTPMRTEIIIRATRTQNVLGACTRAHACVFRAGADAHACARAFLARRAHAGVGVPSCAARHAQLCSARHAAAWPACARAALVRQSAGGLLSAHWGLAPPPSPGAPVADARRAHACYLCARQARRAAASAS